MTSRIPPRNHKGVRAQFEAHIRRRYRMPNLERFCGGTGELAGQYKDFHMEQRWQGYRIGFAAGRRK